MFTAYVSFTIQPRQTFTAYVSFTTRIIRRSAAVASSAAAGKGDNQHPFAATIVLSQAEPLFEPDNDAAA